MKSRYLVVGALLIAGAAVFLFNQRAHTGKEPVQVRTSSAQTNGSSGSAVGTNGKSQREARKSSELAKKYSDSRIVLAKESAKGIMELTDQYIHMLSMSDAELKKLMMSMEVNQERINQAAPGEIRVGVALNGEVPVPKDMEKETRQKAIAILSEYVDRSLEAKKQALAALKVEDQPLLELLLAGDAKARGQMTEDEFAAIRDQNKVALDLVAGGFVGAPDPANDPKVNERLKAIFTPEQWAEWEERKDNPRPTFEAINIESLDEALTYGRVVMSQMLGTPTGVPDYIK